MSKWDQPASSSGAGGAAAGGASSELSEAAQAAAAAAARIAAQLGSQAGSSQARPSGGSDGPARPAQDPHEPAFQDKIEINDQRNRYMLTKGQTQQQIHRETGASVTTKGQWYPDKTLATPEEPPLYLHVTGTTQDMVDKAVAKIHELMEQDLPQLVEDRHQKRLEWEAQRPPPREQRERRRWPEEKVPINLTTLPNFNVRAKVVGFGGLFVKFIQQETGAKVQIKGRGSGFREFDTQQESDEPMHIHLVCSDEEALKEAKRLAEDLVDAVTTEHAKAEAILRQTQPMYAAGAAGAVPAAAAGGAPGYAGGQAYGGGGAGYAQDSHRGGASGGSYQQGGAGASYSGHEQGYGGATAQSAQAGAGTTSTPSTTSQPAVKPAEEDAVDKYWKDYVAWEKTFRNYHGRAPTKEDGGQTIPAQYTHLLK